MAESSLETWKKRVTAAKDLHEEWEKTDRVRECYNYWKGEQLESPYDEHSQRRIQINKVHPEVRNTIPSLYYYRPYLRLTASPENTDDPGTSIAEDTKLLQDTVNYLVRDKRTAYRANTYLGLKEAFWSMGIVEIGYEANFVDVPGADKPPLKEKKDTRVEPTQKEMGAEGAEPPEPIEPPEGSDEAAIVAQVEKMKLGMTEHFYVKHIPAKHLLVSISDMPIVENNDWIGYYEDVPLEDVKRSPAYENTDDLKPATGDPESDREAATYNDTTGETDKIRLYRIWDIRTRQKLVYAEGHEKWLLRKPFKRFNLKFLRFDVDPYHFYPRPPILNKLGPQDEYNDSREYLRKVRKGTVPRYTYDEDAIDKLELQKLESGQMGTYVPRHAGTSNVIEPINQPSFSENAIQTLTLSDKEFQDVGGIGGDARVAQSKTATQAKIGEVKNQVQDSFDRLLVAEWLSDIGRELLSLAIENMSLDQFIAVNIAPDTQFAPQIAQGISEQFQRINANILSKASQGIEWDVTIDLESLSPVSEEEKFQKWMQALSLFGNPPMARLFSVSPEVLKHTLDLLGIKSANDQLLILQAMQKVVQMEAMLAMAGQNAAPGVSPQAGGSKPGMPAPKPATPQPGPPQGGLPPKPPMPPTGPGASPQKPM